MKIKKGNYVFAFTVILAVIGMIFQALAVLFGYDPVMQVFKRESIIGNVSTAVLFFFCILLAVIGLKGMKSGNMQNRASERSDNLTAFLSAMAGCSVMASSLILFAESRIAGSAAGTVSTLLALISVPAGLSFLLTAFGKNITYLGFFPPVWGAVCLMRIYFDVGSAINDPVRILFQISIVSVMLALLYELKERIKGNGTASFVVAASISVLLGCASALSMMILYFVVRTVSVGEVLLSASELIICMYLLVKLYQKCK